MKKLCFTFLFLLFQAQAFDSVAKVEALRGEASVQINEKIQSLKLNDELEENSLVHTNKMSLLKLRLRDGTLITLTPNSTLVLDKVETKKPSLIQLLSGKLRAQVQKRAQGAYSLFVKSPTASLGIRGTDFELIYNPTNKISSALTFTGELAFINAKGLEHFDSIQATHDYDEAYEEVLSEEFESEKTKTLHAREFSGAFPGYNEALVPVRIAKDQFEALKNAQNFSSYALRDKVHIQQAGTETQVNNDVLVPRPRADYTEENYPTNIVAKPGGYLDQETGIYISPPADALFDEREKVYIVPQEFGKIDEKTGDYIPPLGLLLHPLKGFIYLEDQFSKLSESSLRLVKKLNNSLKMGMTRLKELTRLDASLLPALYYDSNVTRDFYERTEVVTHRPSMILSFDGFLAHKSLDSKNWLIYPKGTLKTRYHYNQEEKTVNTQDTIDWTGSLEINHRYLISHRPGRQIFDVGYHIQMRDQEGKDQYNFDTEDLFVIFGQEFKLHHKQTTKIYGKFRYYETVLDKMGTIWSGHLLHSIDMGRKHDLILGGTLMRERPHNERTIFGWEGLITHLRKNLWENYQWASSLRIKYTDLHLILPERDREYLFSPEIRVSRIVEEYLKFSVFLNYEHAFSSQKTPYQYEKYQSGLDMNFLF